MTHDETKLIIRSMMAAYPNFKPDNIAETIAVWELMLKDKSYKEMEVALMQYIRTNNSGFAPSIGQLMECLHTVTTPQTLSEYQAWAMVMKAIRNSAYNADEEFAKLPEVVQASIGTAHQLHSMAIDPEFNESVASSNFMRTYRAMQARKKELAKMSPETLKLTENAMKRLSG